MRPLCRRRHSHWRRRVTIAVSSRHTMAGAQRIVVDDGFRVKRPYRRERLIALSQRWQAAQNARQRTAAAISEVIERTKRQHRRTRPGNHGANPHKIIAMVAAWHGIGPRDVLSKSRRDVIVAAKHDAVAAVYLNCKIDGRRYSLTDLARVFDVDHTTAHHALKRRGLR